MLGTRSAKNRSKEINTRVWYSGGIHIKNRKTEATHTQPNHKGNITTSVPQLQRNTKWKMKQRRCCQLRYKIIIKGYN